MCKFDHIIGQHTVAEPITAYKAFRKTRLDACMFSIVAGIVKRGVWLRYDDPSIVNHGSLCETFQHGFHAFTRMREARRYGAEDNEIVLPVEFKGEITLASQHDEEILVAEWMRIPLDSEIKDGEIIKQEVKQ
jgi:hypothetical protein